MPAPPDDDNRPPLVIKTKAEDALHRKACKASRCQWCSSLEFLEKHATAFQCLQKDQEHALVLDGKSKALAGKPWLGKAHRGDVVVLGCIPCRALKDRRLANTFANYAISAARLRTATGKPHMLLRHARSTVHKAAVAEFLGIPRAAGGTLSGVGVAQ